MDMERPIVLRRVLKREITPEIRESRERDMDSVLDAYRENLRSHRANDEEAIETFLFQECEKMEREYDSLDHGGCAENIYYIPMDWESIASDMRAEEENNSVSV